MAWAKLPRTEVALWNYCSDMNWFLFYLHSLQPEQPEWVLLSIDGLHHHTNGQLSVTQFQEAQAWAESLIQAAQKASGSP